MEHAQGHHDPLYVCFVDLIKAYDTVPRHMLWHFMASIGVPPQFVQAVRSLYEGIICQVRVDRCLGPEFHSTIGVKQGCPLSPTLFGISIARLQLRMVDQLPCVGPCLSSGMRVPMLLYADDFDLLGRAGIHMRLLLSEVDSFNAASGMHANTGPGKTEMMLLGALLAECSFQEAQTFTKGGKVIAFVQ